MTTKPLTDERLAALARETMDKARSYTDPKTGTVEIRVLELAAIVVELIARRQGIVPRSGT